MALRPSLWVNISSLFVKVPLIATKCARFLPSPTRNHCAFDPYLCAACHPRLLSSITTYPVTEKLGRYLREQEREIFSENFNKHTLQFVWIKKSQLVHMRAVILPVQDICNFLLIITKDGFDSKFPKLNRIFATSMTIYCVRLMRSMDSTEMLSVAMDTFMAVVNMGQNEVVRKLVAWQASLAVPTAVAGIWWDELWKYAWTKMHYAYYILLAFILTICFTLYYRFKKAGWLGNYR